MNLSDKQTEAELKRLENRIRAEYAKAYAEIAEETRKYFAKFRVQDAEMKAQMLAGQITQDYYYQWRVNHIGMGNQWQQLRDTMAMRMANADVMAAAYMNDTTPGIYSINYNYSAFELETEAFKIAQKYNMVSTLNFQVLNEKTIRRLMMKNQLLLPPRQANIPKALVWNKQKLQSELTTGLLKGESARGIARRFKTVVGMDERAAIRNARTAVTGAQNAGRYESYCDSAAMGFPVSKKWIATLDSTTRDSHRKVDGEIVPYDQYFSNDLMYPGDPHGSPKEVYNCRCTMGRVIEGINDRYDVSRFARDSSNNSAIAQNVTYSGRDGTMSYPEWLKAKG